MLRTHKAPRKPATRSPFRQAPWDEQQADFRILDDAFPPDHHVRWLCTAAARLDLTALRQSYAGYGSLAYPPEHLLPFVLFMYSRGILSPTRWAVCARYDDQAKWLLRGLVPSRTTLYDFRDRTAPFLDDWHKQLIAWAVAEGITTATQGSLDGTFVAALASRHQLMSARRLDRRLLLLRRLVELDRDDAADLACCLEQLPGQVLLGAALWQETLCLGAVEAAVILGERLLDQLDLLELLGVAEDKPGPVSLPSWVPRSRSGRRRVLRRYEQARQRLAQRLLPYQQKKKLSKKDQATVKRLKVSLTDSEAALGWDKEGTFRPLYNVLLVQATDAPLTLAWEVLPRNNDDGLLKPMMERTHAQLGRHVQDVLVDGAFATVGEVAWCEAQGVTVYGPPEKAPGKTRKQQRQAPSTGTGPSAAKLPKEAFRYDPEEGVYYCPEGKRLEELQRTTLRRSNGIELPMIVHRAKGEDCQQCPRQAGCTSSPKKGRTVKRYEGEEALERLRQRMAEPEARQVYRRRGQSVELGYADLKTHRGLRVLRCYGRERARVQAGLVILAGNSLAVMSALRRRQQGAAQPPPQPVKQPA